ncbi:MAG: aminomethyl-transferring glycine dehydrogenase, partial [Verrucomicrobiia bacterium]
SYIGAGYYGCVTPPVIQRNILENPAWYTSYTPYQSEISQGRLEMLLNFQTMVCDLTGFEISNASLLDEATACAEAMMMCHRLAAESDRRTFVVAADVHPQNLDVVETRARALDLELQVAPPAEISFNNDVFGVLLQYPSTTGEICDLAAIVAAAQSAGAFVVVATDPLALTLLKPPGEFGADIAVGNSQRFGVPLGFGGPHAAFLATRDKFKRQMPGRLVGVSRDSRGRPAFRLALGTREQHIRREKATSNICTAQALPANMAAAYAVYHGPDGLRRIATRIHTFACMLAAGLARKDGLSVVNRTWFDTLTVQVGDADAVRQRAEEKQINLRAIDPEHVGVALDETVTETDLEQLLDVFGVPEIGRKAARSIGESECGGIPAQLRRKSSFLSAPVFNRYHSETEMLRYLRRLESRDLSLCQSMIPLGSCTMKLNATSAMLPLGWDEFSQIHPFAPKSQIAGYQKLFEDLEKWVGEITGLPAVSLQPNAGSQGEYAGLLVIRKYHENRGEGHRRICLIPASAHGTNPASSAMAGLQPVHVRCDASGNIDLADLREKARGNAANLAALMVTYPSTHGVFEESIREVCQIIHDHGGQVYMDGANLNAQVGLMRPADLGADACHLNLHKTFAIPHGGGGPGAGPIAVASHLAQFLPGHIVTGGRGQNRVGAVSAAPYGSACILTIPWVYIACMGAEGLTTASLVAILNANYIAQRLAPFYPIVYKGAGGWVAHECIIDLRQFDTVTAEDVAKRLMDYGFHAPTLSWPVSGTLMIEPTESESKDELDRFCDAMISIHREIMAIETGKVDAQNNLLKNAPHTADMIASADWNRPYTRMEAAFPVKGLLDHKFWPAVGRIDNVYGDRNPVCTCAAL